MKKILGLMVAALLVMMMVGGGTWAYFSDTETSEGNTFAAGTLDLTRAMDSELTPGSNAKANMTPPTNPEDGITDLVGFDHLAPGDSGWITWTLVNTGTMKGYLDITSVVEGGTNGTNEPELAAIALNGAVDLNLADLMGVRLTVSIPSVSAGAEQNLLGDATNMVPLSGLQAALNAQTNKLFDEDTGTDDTYVYKLYWSLATDLKKAFTDGKFGTGDDVDVNDNILQSDSATFTITFELQQRAAE